MNDAILYAVADGIATITFNRPRAMNALDPPTIRRFRAVCEQLESDTAARVAVLRGAGPAFVAGGDVLSFQKRLAEFAGEVADMAGELHHGILALRRAPKPVIAAVHGAVAGAGMSIMMACDMVIAAQGTQFTLAYSRIGASPDGGASWFLPRLAGYLKAMEMLLLSDAYDAAAMQAMGIVNRVVAREELQAVSTELARRLAAGPATAYAEIKGLLNIEQKQVLTEQLAAEARAFARCAAHTDFAEGVTAFVEKRAPVFGKSAKKSAD
jgi:2-(1,2-epoxy-1,2-dihydrophenyl)acetyl-CoA isomerase